MTMVDDNAALLVRLVRSFRTGEQSAVTGMRVEDGGKPVYIIAFPDNKQMDKELGWLKSIGINAEFKMPTIGEGSDQFNVHIELPEEPFAKGLESRIIELEGNAADRVLQEGADNKSKERWRR